MTELRKEYNSSGESVQDLFDRREEGFFIPSYQRKYTWEADNINQLFDDLVLGIQNYIEDASSATFLGTTILSSLQDKSKSVNTEIERAQPTNVQIVIDGQQRLSTLALLSMQITEKLKQLCDELHGDETPNILRFACNDCIVKLRNLYTVRVGKGAQPELKPKIIRENDDYWKYYGNNRAYTSPIALCISTYIDTKDFNKVKEALTQHVEASKLLSNATLIDEWLEKICATDNNGIFSDLDNICKNHVCQSVLCKFSISKDKTTSVNKNYFEKYSSGIVAYQLLLLAYYLLNRCGVSRLQPANEEWGLDMFQALNATGTPLTVLETFLPQVMQAEKMAGNEWETSPSRESFDVISKLLDVPTNESKNTRTNELLRSFALCFDGTELKNKFSLQRAWIKEKFGNRGVEIEEKRKFLQQLATTASFYSSTWYMDDVQETDYISDSIQNRITSDELATFSIQYLRKANSRLSAPVLSLFYSRGSVEEFAKSAKACAAFFTLWRFVNTTTGLDDVYRKFCRSTINADNISVADLKSHFLGALQSKDIEDSDKWLEATTKFVMHDEQQTVCRFLLFVASHNQVPDKRKKGLTKKGRTGTCEMLHIDKWNAPDYSTVEHVAPKNPKNKETWDESIYEKNYVHQIGNLILLPRLLNTLAGNKDWPIKYLYYSYVGQSDDKKLESLRKDLGERGVTPSSRAEKALSKTKYACAIAPILELKINGKWNSKIIQKRNKHLLSIASKKLFSWLR